MMFRKWILSLAALMIALSTHAQQFVGNGGDIPDFTGEDIGIRFPLMVNGLPEHLDSTFGLEKACLNISHPHVSDLKIELISPDGTSIWLTNRNGGDKGVDYLETCFRMNGFNGYVYEGIAPFKGTFIPDGKIPFINNGQNPNGRWELLVHDLRKEITGSVSSFTLTFGNHPPDPMYKRCHQNNGAGCACADGSQRCELLPDLIVSEKMTQLLHEEYPWNDKAYPHQIRLAVATANIGWGPVETRGTGKWICGKDTVSGADHTCPNGEAPRQVIKQVIYRREENQITSLYRDAGTNYFDNRPGHMHFHAEHWVDFTLRKRSGRSMDPRRWKIIGRGTKASYCLFDSGNCTDENGLCQDGTMEQIKGFSNLANYGFGRYADCQPEVQGISVGGIDNYGMTFEGQDVTLPDKLKSGEYYLVVEVDPLNKIKESNEDNNVIAIPIKIRKQEHR